MKHSIKSLLFATTIWCLIFFISCSKDDGPEPVKKEEVAEKPEEKREDQPKEEEPPVEQSNMLADNIIIKGSTKVKGVPPTPNKAITMDLSGAGTSAVVDEGFNVPIISDADLVGAYIQFKAIGGGLSESYYDIDIVANQDENEPIGKRYKFKRSELKKTMGTIAKTIDSELDIDFGPEIALGKFCYVICVYDSSGNISEPQEVCVTVSSWSGREALVGTWNLKKWEDLYEGTTDTEIVGEEYCNEFGCETQEYGTVTFKADGTYEFKERYIDREIDGVYGAEFDEYEERGKWSYPEAENSDLVIVAYYYSATDESGSFEETYASGEAPYVGVIAADGIELTDTDLTVTERYDDDGDGNFEEIYTEYYEKQ